LEDAFNEACGADGHFLLDGKVERDENVYPMVRPGTGNADFVEDPRGRVREP
jgi:thiamine pyrophosphate-dependent acetolactate synthase large subunit-like protein